MKHTLLIHAPALLATTLLIPFGLHAFDGTATVVSQGVTREFIYHAPGNTVPNGLPLVLAFHGLGSNPYELQYMSGFDAVADAGNFIVAYPLATQIGGDIQWNVYADDVPGHAGVGEPGATDDVVFVDDLVDWFCSNHHVDASRLYVTGHSNGGNFCYLLSLQRPDKFAAFAPTAANLWGDDTYMTNMLGNAFTPVAIYHVHGDPDSVVPYPDAVHDPTQWTWPLSSYGNGNCGVAEYTLTTIVPGVDRLSWCDGSAPNGKRVELIRVSGVDHNWADAPGYTAASAIWEFLSAFVINAPAFSCATGVDEPTSGTPIAIQPNVVDHLLRFSRPLVQADVWILDMQGRVVLRRTGFSGSELPLRGLAAARYTVRIDEAGVGTTTLPMVKPQVARE